MAIIYQKSTFCSIEQYQQSFKYVDQDVIKLAGGSYQADLSLCMLDGVTVMENQVNHQVLYQGATDMTNYIFAIYSAQSEIVVNGYQLGAKQLYLLCPNELFVASCPDDYHGHGLMISKGEMCKLLGADKLRFIDSNSENIRTGRIELNRLNYFKSKVANLARFILINHQDLPLTVIHDVRESLLDAVFCLFNHVETTSKPSLFNKRLTIVNRANEFLQSIDNINITIDELARQCFCSRRTLEYAFRQVTTLSPNRYLKIKRMYQIRARFIGLSLGEIHLVLSEFGVVNQGRFSKDYWSIFGEYPKETLQKIHLP